MRGCKFEFPSQKVRFVAPSFNLNSFFNRICIRIHISSLYYTINLNNKLKQNVFLNFLWPRISMSFLICIILLKIVYTRAAASTVLWNLRVICDEIIFRIEVILLEYQLPDLIKSWGSEGVSWPHSPLLCNNKVVFLAKIVWLAK